MRYLLFVLLLSTVTMAWDKDKKKAKPAPVTTTASAAAKAASKANASSKSSSSASNVSDLANNAANSTNVSENQTYKEIRQTPFAYAPEAIPTSPCIKGVSAGASSPLLAGAFGTGKVDKGCDSRETARQFALMHNFVAAAKILCSTDAAKRAHLTQEDCQAMEKIVEPVPAPVVEVHVTVPEAPVVREYIRPPYFLPAPPTVLQPKQPKQRKRQRPRLRRCRAGVVQISDLS